MSPAQPDILIDGFRTPLVNIVDPKYQADQAFKPDKAALWTTHRSRDGWVLAHNAVRFELGENPQLSTLDHTPCILNPQHSTLSPQPCKPCKPSTLNPRP